MSASDKLSILACQADVPQTRTAADRDRHIAALGGKVRAALTEERADVVVLPELSSIEYSRPAFEQLDRLAEALDGPSFETWAAVARDFDTHVAYSFPRRDEDGRFRITLAVAGPDGALAGHYDKIHLAQFGASMEKEFFTPGHALFAFDVSGFRLAPIICADIRFPELSRALTVEHGADIILHAGAYFRDPSFHSWHHFAVTRALENQIYFVSLNRAGRDYGSSLFCPPWVDETLHPLRFDDYDEQFMRLVADRAEIDQARESYAFLQDRLDRYG